MDSIIHFFEQIPSSQRTIILVSGFTFFWILENSLPLFAFKYNKWQHALLNIFFTLTTLLVNLGFAFVIISAADYTSQHQSGLLYLLPLPLWLHVVLGVLLLDFIGAWLIHWVEHRVPFMWRFHIIHHTDTKVDVTTALRHHPGESVFRAAFTILAIFVAGVPVGVVMLYQTLSALFAQLTHANMRMPRQLDKLLSYVLVSPHMHKIHHHYQLPLTDTNYGNIFSIWDRLFGTYAEAEPQSLVYGLDTHMREKEHSRLGSLLLIPFKSPEKNKVTPEG